MKNSINVLIISVIVGVVLIGSLIAFGKKSEEEKLTLPITVEEFADFQCPACAQFYETANEIKAIEGVEFTYNHFPLTTIHERAYASAIASEAAREQGKFQEYHDKLFQNQDGLEDEDFFKYAEELKLDVEKFKDDYKNNQALKDRVDADVAEGEEKAVNSTPTLIVNGKKFTMVGKDYAQIVSEIKDMVEKAKANEVDPIESPVPSTETSTTPVASPTE